MIIFQLSFEAHIRDDDELFFLHEMSTFLFARIAAALLLNKLTKRRDDEGKDLMK
jgi:hypothetical protein